jgi:hypothetical protein
MMADRQELSKRMTMHLNMGSKGGSAVFEILADGQPTNLAHSYAPDPDGGYAYTFTAEDEGGEVEELDATGMKMADVLDWCHERLRILVEPTP